MVRSLLDGSKTQTRRIVKLQPFTAPLAQGERYVTEEEYRINAREGRFPCPYGQPGDQLWVRESFWGCDMPGYGDQPCVVYDDEWHGKEYLPAAARPWARKFGRIPSIHMPRDCSRITLEIVSVRVERLQDISEADAIAEGIERHPTNEYWIGGPHKSGGKKYHADPCIAYRDIWESINGAGSWVANPWVWIIEFKQITCDKPDEDSDDEGGYCPNCNGSGEGMTDGSICLVCKGGVYS